MGTDKMRQPFEKRVLLIRSKDIRERALALIRNLPVDAEKPLEIVIQEHKKRRSNDANARMWAGPLKDLAEQAWLDGKQFSAEVWHFYLKRQLLPEEFDPDLCKEAYRKWEYDPAGDRVLVGSTTDLTVKGFAEYMIAIEAFACSLGVQLSASPNEVG